MKTIDPIEDANAWHAEFMAYDASQKTSAETKAWCAEYEKHVPKHYISRVHADGKFQVIFSGSPLCRETDIQTAIDIAAKNRIQTEILWDGIEGRYAYVFGYAFPLN